jgi:AcrR family transcriptional regulator
LGVEKKPEQIILAAAKLFARYGYEGVTMRDIAEAADVTMSALYYHFESKEELHEEVTQLVFADFFGGIVAKWQASPERSPSQLLAIIFDEALRDPTNFLLMQHDMHHYDDGRRLSGSRKRAQQFLDLFKESLLPRHPQVSDSDVFIVASLISGILELVHADQRMLLPGGDRFIRGIRDAMIGHIRKAYE